MSMHATTTQSQGPKIAKQSEAVDLLSLLNEWTGKSQFGPAVLLRSLPCRSELRSHDQDVDLLVTSEQATELLRLAFEDVQNGRCHVQIESRHRSKIQLVLWTTEASDSLRVDLWLEWNQMLSRRRIIAASSFQPLVQQGTSCRRNEPDATDQDATLTSAARLCGDVELAMLVLHVLRKKNGIASGVNSVRILRLVRSLKSDADAGSDTGKLLAAICSDLDLVDDTSVRSLGHTILTVRRDANSIVISQATGMLAQALLESRLKLKRGTGLALRQQWVDRVKSGFRSVMRTVGRTVRSVFSPLSCPTLAFVGSDGSGKTSLSELVSAAHPGKWRTVVGRKLYRRSLFYSVFSSVTRRVFGISRNDFDDRLATFLAFRAMMVCWVMIFWLRIRNSISCSKRGLVLDRTPESMLVVGRRGVQSTVALGARFVEYFAPPLRQVLLVVPYSILSKRKQELSSSSHEQYQRLLFEQMIRQPVVSTLLLSNAASPLAALEALEEIFELAPHFVGQAVLSQAGSVNGTAVSVLMASHQIPPTSFLPQVMPEHRKEWAA